MKDSVEGEHGDAVDDGPYIYVDNGNIAPAGAGGIAEMEALTMNSVMNRRGVPRSDRAPARPGWAEGFSLDLLRSEPLLVNSGLLLLLVFLAFGAGMALDPRTIQGAPAWLKPAKFAISTGIYCLTLAWVFTHLPDWPRTRRLVGWLTGVRRIARASA